MPTNISFEYEPATAGNAAEVSATVSRNGKQQRKTIQGDAAEEIWQRVQQVAASFPGPENIDMHLRGA
jgi:hypothetical protein